MIWWMTAVSIGAEPITVTPLANAVARTRGPKKGSIVLWPRIIPATTDGSVLAAAAAVQQRLVESVETVSPNRVPMVLPEPQRVCPQEGCRVPSIGVLIGHSGGGCVAVAVVGDAGRTDQQLFPLAGQVTLDVTNVAFRRPPEDVVSVDEFVPCAELAGRLQDGALVGALRRRLR